jgi:hypothetical protein
MRVSKDQIPAKINVPGAVARQAIDFGDATGFGKMAREYFSLGAGTDIAPLLKGLKLPRAALGLHDHRRARRHVHGRQDRHVQGERPALLAARPQCSRRQDAEIILFSPQREHTDVMNHMLKAMKG